MNSLLKYPLIIAALLGIGMHFSHADGLEPAVQAKVDAMTKEIQALAASPAIVDATKAYNAAALSADAAAMTQDKWKSLSVLDPFVRSFQKNPTGEFLKSKKTDVMSEAFLSGADGNKIAFLAKTSSFCHKGKPKFDVPMTGKTWQGPVEVDESSGVQQVQVAVPVLDGGKPIGVLVAGISISKLG